MSTPDLEQWLTAWPGCRPIGYELRHDAGDRWVRLHSLPGAQRYADNADEYAEIVRRHLAVLERLTGSVHSPLFVVAQSWAAATEVDGLDPQTARILAWEPWATLPTDPDPDSDDAAGHTRLWLGQCSSLAPALVSLLMLAADDEARLLLFDESLSWLYAPYDGGADVILSDPHGVQSLREQFRPWLSERPDGL